MRQDFSNLAKRLLVRKRGLWTLFFLCAFTLAVCAQQARPSLTNDDIIKMTKDAFSESVIVTLIESSDPAFDVSVSGLTTLKAAGVTSKVMETMLKVDAKKRQSAAATTNKPAPTAPAQTMVPSPMSGAAMGPAGIAQQILASVMGGGSSGMLDMSQLPPVTRKGAVPVSKQYAHRTDVFVGSADIGIQNDNVGFAIAVYIGHDHRLRVESTGPIGYEWRKV